MVKRIAMALALAGLSAAALRADFSYEQTSRVTGGMMAGLMKFAGALSKQAREPIRSTVVLKGNRMARTDGHSGQIVDLDRETITMIDFQKRTYSVVTFAQMADALKQLESKKPAEEGPAQADVSLKASVKETGQTKAISGLNAREVVVTLEMEGTDETTGKRGTFMVFTSDMWMAEPPGYDEYRRFQRRMAERLSWTPEGGAFAQGRRDMMRGMAELQKEASKLEGVAVYQVVKMQGAGPAAAQMGQPAPEPQARPQAEEQERPSVGGAVGRLGGRLGGLGGLGGLGRRKKAEPQAEPQPQATPQAQPAGAPGSLMEVTTELTGFSAAPVDPSKLEVPAGFKQVESEMLRFLRQ